MPPTPDYESDPTVALLREALRDSVLSMVRHGMTPDDLRADRLRETFDLLCEYDSTAKQTLGPVVTAALALPRVRPNRPASESAYQRALMTIQEQAGTPPAAALRALLCALIDSQGSFARAVAACRRDLPPTHAAQLAAILDHYALHGVDAHLKEVALMAEHLVPR